MNEMINASTALLPLLTVDNKNSLYYNSSISIFCFVATINHILPENLDGLTHFVKLLFSNILFSLIDLNPYLGILISLIDLTPLFTDNKQFKKIGELFIQVPRLLIEVYLIYNLFHENQLECALMIIFKVIYFFERRARIKQNNRNNFSTFHSAEHCGLYLLFKLCTKTDFCLVTTIKLVSALIVIMIFFLHFISRYMYMYYAERAPDYVKNDKELMAIIKEKTAKNAFSKKFRNYLMKNWSSHLKLEFVSWAKIDEICDKLAQQVRDSKYEFDMVVGIATGGSFVGACMAKKLGLPYSIIRSKLWSEINFKENFTQTINYFSGKPQKPRVMGDVPEVQGKKVLLVDDTTYTGITMNGIKKHIEEGGNPKEVKTMVMWMRGNQSHTDYFYCLKRIPIMWEWGAEVD